MKHYSGIVLLLIGLRLYAQAPVVQAYSTNSLGHLEFTCVYQDPQGWIWLGSKNGLYRFDGQEYMPIKLPPGESAAEATVLFSGGGKLWAGFENGKIAYLPSGAGSVPLSTGSFEEDLRRAPQLVLWDPEEGLPKAKITGMAEDRSGAFWISTYGEGLYVWKNRRMYQFNRDDDGLASDEIYAMALDSVGRVWLATDNGVSVCAMPEQGKKLVCNIDKRNGLPDEIITSIIADKQGNIWGGTNEKGIFRFRTDEWRSDFSTKEWPFGPVTHLSLFGDYEVWIGTEKYGMVRFEAGTENLTVMPPGHPLAANRFQGMCKDREGQLWLISDAGGLYAANIRFSTLNTPFTQVQAVCTTTGGCLWVGTQSGLFCRKGAEFRQILPPGINIVSLWQSPDDGVLWAGSLDKGVFLIQPDGKVLRHLSQWGAESNASVLSITGEGDRVWLATLGGISVLNRKTFQPDPSAPKERIGSNYVYKVFTDTKGNVWLGTDGNGLLVFFRDGSFQAFTTANGIPLRTIYSIVEDHQGNIWFSTDRDGLFCLSKGEFKRFSTANHLHSMSISGLAVDGNGRIIIAYSDGFDVLNPDRFDHLNFYGGESNAGPFEVNLNATWSDAFGNVWLGTPTGLVRYASLNEAVVEDPIPGITAVSIYSKAIDFMTENRFEYDQNSMLVNFVGLWYSNPEAVRYRYRLEGFDPDWTISKDHSASYPKLPPGPYVFRVQASEHGNFENVPEAVWSFQIAPPFWQRWWFIVPAFLAFGALLRSFIRTREARLKRVAQLNRERVESQFETLKSQINPHFLFNSFNTLITIIEENPRMAVSYVEHLSDFYRSIMVYRERDFIGLNDEMELVRNFVYLLKKRFEDGFHLEERLSDASGQVMPLSLQILVENAVKHNIISASKPLTVEIFTENGYVVVRNNIQRKIKPEASTHFGLQSLINRYKLLGEKPIVVEDNDAFFTVKIPVL